MSKFLLLTLTFFCFGQAKLIAQTADLKPAEEKVMKFIKWQSAIMTAILKTKDEDSLEALSTVLTDASGQMAAITDQLSKLELTEPQARRLDTIASTSQYNSFGPLVIFDAISVTPLEMQPKIRKLLKESSEKFDEIHKSFNKTLKQNNSISGSKSFGWSHNAKTFEDFFYTEIISVHKDVKVEAEPAHAILFKITAGSPSLPTTKELFSHIIAWKGELPSEEKFEEWITYNTEKRIVTFTSPEESISYSLPNKIELKTNPEVEKANP